MPLGTRLWFAWACFFRVLFDGGFAARALRAVSPEPEKLPPATPKKAPKTEDKPDLGPALQLLALLQREGRLVDFLEQDVAAFGDAEVGAAARVVHDGCRKALREHLELAPVRTEEEGAKVTLEAGFSPSEVKLTGNVQGSAPYNGVLRHRGWRVAELKLPKAMKGHDPKVLAPAEVEL